MSFFSLGRLVCIFSGLGLSSLAPLAISSPEQFPERIFKLKDCVMQNWQNSNTVFKCLKEKDGSNWAFYLNTSWNNWFYGNGNGVQIGRGQSNDLSNTTLTLEKGHSKIKVVSGSRENVVNKTLEIVKLSNEGGKVQGFAPKTINGSVGQNGGIKNTIQSSLKSIENEVNTKR